MGKRSQGKRSSVKAPPHSLSILKTVCLFHFKFYCAKFFFIIFAIPYVSFSTRGLFASYFEVISIGSIGSKSVNIASYGYLKYKLQLERMA